MRKLLSTVGVLVLFSLLLSGCGFKGPLYLPSNSTTTPVDNNKAH